MPRPSISVISPPRPGRRRAFPRRLPALLAALASGTLLLPGCTALTGSAPADLDPALKALPHIEPPFSYVERLPQTDGSGNPLSPYRPVGAIDGEGYKAVVFLNHTGCAFQTVDDPEGGAAAIFIAGQGESQIDERPDLEPYGSVSLTSESGTENWVIVCGTKGIEVCSVHDLSQADLITLEPSADDPHCAHIIPSAGN